MAAKSVGIKVEEFAIGMGPRIWGFKKGETDYNLRLLPIGGYVKMLGEGDYDIHTPDSYGGKKPSQRLLVLVAGVFMNFLLATFLLYISGANLDFKFRNAEVPGFNEDYQPWFGKKSDQKFILAEIAEDSPLKNKAQAFDTIVKINGQEVNAENLNQKLLENENKTIKLSLLGYTSKDEREVELLVPDIDEAFLNTNKAPLIRLTRINDDSPLKDKASEGDVLKLINGQEYTNDSFRKIIAENRGKEIEFTLINDKSRETKVIKFAPLADEKKPPLSVGIAPAYSADSILQARTGLMTFIEFNSPTEKALGGVAQALNTVQNFFFSMGKLFERAFASGSAVPVVDNVGGAISIFDILSKIIVLFGFWGIIELTILFSLNLAVLNILPIPALDGGHVVFTLLEMISRRRLPNAIYNYLTLAGFIFLMGLMVFITAIDIVKFPAINNVFCADGRNTPFVCDLTVRN